MKIKKRIIAALLSAVFILCSVSLPVAAAVANPFTWDGSSALVSGRNYYISDSVTLDGSFTVPEDTSLTVLSGGSITIPRGMTLTQNGNIIIENGASLIISGILSLNSGSSLCIEGTLSSGSGSVLSAYGSVLLSSTSQTALTGVSSLNSDFACYGKLLLSGTVDINTDALIDGIFTVESGGTVTNTGLLTLGENCKYSLYGVFKNNGGGEVNDLRPQYDVSALSVDTMSLYTTDALTGIDVSYAQGEIDWSKVKESGIDFAMIRSSRGRISDDDPMTSDTYFHQNAKGAMQNDIPIGVYHYCYAETVEQARDEARFVLSLID
ncbi:MAG: GH25 family lysozyme, partial [Ruminiclostridium sp.]